MYPSSNTKAESSWNGSQNYNSCKKQHDRDHAEYSLHHGESIETRINGINQILQSFCQFRLGDINSNEKSHKLEILTLIQYLTDEVRIFQEKFNKLKSHRRKSDAILLEREEMLEKMSKEQKLIQNQKQVYIAKRENLDRIHKENLDKMVAERDDLQKQIRKIQAHEKKFQVEIRKKDKQIQHLQESLRKIMEKSQSKGHVFEISQHIQRKPEDVTENSSRQYQMFALHKIQLVYKELTNQNKNLRQFIGNFVQKLNLIVASTQQKIKNLSFFDMTQVSQFKTIANGVQDLPLHLLVGRMEQITKNLDFLQKCIRLSSQTPNGNENPQEKLDGRMKDLVESYKLVITTQNQLLNCSLGRDSDFSQYAVKSEVCYEGAVRENKMEEIKGMLSVQMEEYQKISKRLVRTKERVREGQRKAKDVRMMLAKEEYASGGRTASENGHMI